MPHQHKLDQSTVHLLRVRCAEEVLATVDGDQVRVCRVGEQLDLLLRVLDRVYHVARALRSSLVNSVYDAGYEGKATTHVQPHHRAHDVRQPPVQSIPLSQVDRRHPRSSPPRITPVITLDRLQPEVPDAAVTVFTEPDVDQEVAKRVLGFKVGL